MYAQRSNDEELFLKAIEGVRVEDLLERKDVVAEIAKACDKFQSPKASPKAEAICQKLKSVTPRRSDERGK